MTGKETVILYICQFDLQNIQMGFISLTALGTLVRPVAPHFSDEDLEVHVICPHSSTGGLQPLH